MSLDIVIQSYYSLVFVSATSIKPFNFVIMLQADAFVMSSSSVAGILMPNFPSVVFNGSINPLTCRSQLEKLMNIIRREGLTILTEGLWS